MSFFQSDTPKDKQYFTENNTAAERPIDHPLRNSETALATSYINNNYQLDENTQAVKAQIKDELELFGYSSAVEEAKFKIKTEERLALEESVRQNLLVEQDAGETLKNAKQALIKTELDGSKEKLVKDAVEQLATDAYLKQTLTGTPEGQQRALDVAKSITGFLDTQLSIREYEEKLSAYNQDISTGETIGDLAVAVLIPFMESTGLGDVAKNISSEVFSKAGYVLPSQSLEAIRTGFAKASPEEQKQFIKELYDLSLNRDQVLGLASNRSVNAAIASVALDSLKDGVDINSPEFLGLRLPRVGDVGYDLLAALDVAGAVDLVKIGKGLINYMFGTSVKGLKTSPLSNIENRGALFDGVNKADPEVLQEVLNKTTDLEDTAADLGVKVDDIAARAAPSPTGEVDEVALAPGVTDSSVDEVYEAISVANPLNQIYPEERVVLKQKILKTLSSFDEAKLYPSHFRFKKSKNPESLGTWFVRYGAGGRRGYETKGAAQVLENQLKADGQITHLVKRNNEWFVDISHEHVLTGKDVSGLSAVTGERLTIGDNTIIPYLVPPSRRFKGAVKKVQQSVSRAKDTSAIIGKRLEQSARGFLNLGKRDLEDASQALQRGSTERMVYTEDELREVIPGITDKAIKGYFDARATYDAIADIRNTRYRAKLKERGVKQLLINSEEVPNEFLGEVLGEKPNLLSSVPENPSKSKDVWGNRVWDLQKGEVTELTQAEVDSLYSGLGRIVKLANNYTDEVTGETVAHMVVRGWDNVSVNELPSQVLNRIPGYIEKAYEDVGWMLVQTDVKKKVNGIEVAAGKQAIGAYEFPFQALDRLIQLEEVNPELKYEVLPSREMTAILDEAGMGGSTAPTWMRRRGEKTLEGPLDADKVPTAAATINPVESLIRSIQKTSGTYLQQTEEVLKARFYNQFGKFVPHGKDFSFSEFDPKLLSPEAIREAGLEVRDVRADAAQLHHYINNIREVRSTPLDNAFRAQLARTALGLGEDKGVIRNLASKALLKTSQTAVGPRLRSLTSSLNIAWGVAFQSIQNIITPTTLLVASGRQEGFKSMTKTFELANAMTKRKTSDWQQIKKDLSKSFEVSENDIEKMVDFARQGGVFGTAREVDNLLNVINDVKRVNAGQNALSYYATKGLRVPSYLTELMSKTVAKSIDIASMMYYTHAYRTLSKTVKTQNKDFFEEVRVLARDLGQNQNSSDRFSYESNSNPLAFALQFIQHIHRLGLQGVEVLNKGVTGAKNHSPFAFSRPDAVKTILTYTLLTGSSGFGGERAAAFVNQYLPQDWPEELKQLAIGGFLDVMVNSVGDSNIAVSSRTSPGAAGEFTWSTLEATYQAVVNGVDVGMLETVFGASSSTMSNLAGAAKFMMLDLSHPSLSTTEQAVQAALSIAQITKLGRDVDKAKIMLKFEANIASSKLTAKGKATALEAMARVFGFPNYTEVLHNQALRNKFYEDSEFKRTTDFLTKHLMKTFIDSKDYTEYLQTAKQLTRQYSLIYGPDEIKKATTQATTRIKTFLDSDKGIGDKLLKDLGRLDINHRIKRLEEFARIPGVSETSRQRALELAETFRNPPTLSSKEP